MPAFPPLTDLNASVTLNDGHHMPIIAAGTWMLPGDDCVKALTAALDMGYRHIDTAAIYGNEREVGQAMKASRVDRESVFLTTKLWNNAHLNVEAALDASLKRLQVDYLDLYLIHWPLLGQDYRQAWRAMESQQQAGKIRSIGVCNFTTAHLDQLLAEAEVVPAINQVETHPWLRQPELFTYLAERGIQAQAWSPLMNGRWPEAQELLPIADKHGKTVPQIILRWLLERGLVVLPKSKRPERLAQNLDLFDFELDAQDTAAIDALDRDERTGPDPDTFDFGTDLELLDPAKALER